MCIRDRNLKEAKLQAKQAAVADVVDKMQRAQSVVVLDYRGLTVAELSLIHISAEN